MRNVAMIRPLASRLFETRRRRGLSTRVVAALFGVPTQSVLSWESGVKPITRRLIPEIEQWIETAAPDLPRTVRESRSPRHAPVEFAKFDSARAERAEQRDAFKNAERTPQTVNSYAADFRVFSAWCAAAGLSPLPTSEETVELYATDMLARGRQVTTVMRHAAGINRKHAAAGLDKPCGAGVRLLLCGARRLLCQRPDRKEAIRVEHLRAMVECIGWDTAIAARNCAILLFGFVSALRRSSLVRLELEDLDFRPEGILVRVSREKQDRKGKGRDVAVPKGKHPQTCPVRAVKRWLKWRGNSPGPLFQRVVNKRVMGKRLLGNRISQIVQESVAAIGLDWRSYGAHSLRAGLASEALGAGVNEIVVAQQTGHASLDTLQIYYRPENLFEGNPARKLDL